MSLDGYLQRNTMEKFKYADVEVITDPRSKHCEKGTEGCSHVHHPGTESRDVDPYSEVFLRTNWQVQGYLMEQADAIEK